MITRNPRSKSYRSFFFYGLFTCFWQTTVFLHRNAPTDDLSRFFFRFSGLTHPLLLPFLLFIIIYLVKDGKKYLALLSPAVLLLVYGNLLEINIVMSDYGWSYELPDHLLYLGFIIYIFYTVLIISYSSLIIKNYKSSSLNKKIKIIVGSFILFEVFGFLIFNAYIFSHPRFPPFGGIMSILTLVLTGYAVSIKSKKEVAFEDVDGSISHEYWLEFIEKVRDLQPGKELGEDKIESMNLLAELIGSKHVKNTNKIYFRPPDINEAIDNSINFMKRYEWSLEAIDSFKKLFNEIYRNFHENSERAAEEWLDDIIEMHGGFLIKHDLLVDLDLGDDHLDIKEYFDENIILNNEENEDESYRLLEKGTQYTLNCTCITKFKPTKLEEKYDIDGAKFIFISHEGGNEHTVIKPDNLKKLYSKIKNDLEKPTKTMLLIDCFDQILFANGLDRALEFLKRTIKMVKKHDSTLIIMLNEKLIEKHQLSKIKELVDRCK